MDAKSNSKKSAFIKAKKEAISWLLGGSDDFLTVCELANLDNEYVMRKAKEALNRDCIWRKVNFNSHKKPLCKNNLPKRKKNKKIKPSEQSKIISISTQKQSAKIKY